MGKKKYYKAGNVHKQTAEVCNRIYPTGSNFKTVMKKLFHQLANEGKAITILKQKFEDRGIHFSAARIEIIIKLKKLKQLINHK